MKAKWIFAVVILTMQLKPAAAGQEGHGGDVLVCAGQEPEVLDYYFARLGTVANPNRTLMDFSGMTADQVIDAFSARFQNSGFQEKFDRKRAELDSPKNWVITGELVDVKDDGLAFNVPAGCTLRQGAVNFDSTVYLNGDIAATLSEVQLGILAIHEIVFALHAANKTDRPDLNSKPIRHFLREALAANIDDRRFHQSFDRLSIGRYFYFGYSGMSADDDKFEYELSRLQGSHLSGSEYSITFTAEAKAWRADNHALPFLEWDEHVRRGQIELSLNCDIRSVCQVRPVNPHPRFPQGATAQFSSKGVKLNLPGYTIPDFKY